MNPETSEKLIAGLTDALCAATHEGLRDHTWVIVEGHDPKNWGQGGKPWPVGEMPPGRPDRFPNPLPGNPVGGEETEEGEST